MGEAGLSVLLLGVIILIVGIILILLSLIGFERHVSKGKTSLFGFILIGPIPIVFGKNVSRETVIILVAIGLLLTLLAIGVIR